jgi:hypothetical protein
MKKVLLAIALLSALPLLVNAEETMPKKEHHMQNSNPEPVGASTNELVDAAAPEEHHMQNANPAPAGASTSEKAEAKVHHMKNN